MSDDWQSRVDPKRYPPPLRVWPPVSCGPDHVRCPLKHPDVPEPENGCVWYVDCVAILHGAQIPQGVTLNPGESVTFVVGEGRGAG